MNQTQATPHTFQQVDPHDCKYCQTQAKEQGLTVSGLYHTPEKHTLRPENVAYLHSTQHKSPMTYQNLSPISHHKSMEEEYLKQSGAPRGTFKSLFTEESPKKSQLQPIEIPPLSTTRNLSPPAKQSLEQEKRSAQFKNLLAKNNSPSIESRDTPQKPSPLKIETNNKSEQEKLLKERAALIKEFREMYILDKVSGYKPNVEKQEFAEGCVYEGNMQYDRKHGKGLYIYDNGDAYMGDWSDNFFHGVGIYFFANGERYEGQLEDGMKHGKGTYHYLDFKRYTGQWVHDRKHGKGVYDYYGKKEKYDGDFQNGKRHGFGTYYYASGEKWMGQWANNEKVEPEGTKKPQIVIEKPKQIEIKESQVVSIERSQVVEKPQVETVKKAAVKPPVLKDVPIIMGYPSGDGYGMIKFPNGDTFEGTWKSGLFYDYGIYTYSNGDKYEGEWHNSLKTGKGILTLRNGDQYIGHWAGDQQNGEGVLKHADGDRYEGDFKNSRKHGNGTMKFRNGDVYIGSWENGYRHGKGVYKFNNGDSYEGFWMNDKKNGKGTYTWQDGTKYYGTWTFDAINEEELRYSGFVDATQANFQRDARDMHQIVLV